MTFRRISGFWFTDLIVSMIVVGVVVAIFASEIKNTMKSVRVAATASEALQSFRTRVSVYYAVNGAWPEDTEELQEFFPYQSNHSPLNLAKAIRVADGAIDVELNGPMEGNILTIHPAVLLEEPTGPVTWVAGPGASPGRLIVGKDRSTVTDNYIHYVLRSMRDRKRSTGGGL